EGETPEGEGEGEPGEGEGEEEREGEQKDREQDNEEQNSENDDTEDLQEGSQGEEAGRSRPDPKNELVEGEREGRAEEANDGVTDQETLDEEVRERDAVIARNQEEDREVAEAAFEEAIEEGVDPREAAFRAEQAVRENKVGRRLESLEEAVGDGKTLEQALGDELDRSGGSIDELFIIEEGAFRSLDAAFRDPNSEGFSRIVDETFNEEREGERAFRDALLEGGNVDDAFNAAFITNISSGADFIEANIFSQGFDPGLVAQSRIIEQVNEAFITNVVSSGLVTEFTENITLTAGDDNVSGAPGAGANTTFIATQGTTLGGNDIIDGGAGTDQLNLLNLSNLLIIGSSYTNPGGDISGRISLTNVEQINFVSAGGDTETFGLAGPSSSSGTGFVLVGTSGNDTLSIVPDGTSAADLSKGTLSLDIDGNGTGINTGAGVLFADGGDDTITFEGNRRFIFGGDGDDTITLGVGEINVVQGGAGNDTFVLEEENSLFGSGGRFSSVGATLISGGEGVDTLQIGNSSSAANQSFTVEGFDSGNFSTITGMEKLHFFQSGTVFRTGAQMFTQFTTITAESGVTGVSLVSTNGVLNLSENELPSAVTTLSAAAPATDPTFQNGGVRVF
ncbi:MAG: calcium-binding protein, partial [Pseudomonadota bacterium]|nr:calcium-binding protein [Pseudomonadota bacterium]